MPVNPTEKGNNYGVLVDCVVRIVGWFQISGVLDPSTGNYLPETNQDGTPVSGPGWTAYQKAGAQPGDIVVIYTLNTSGISLPSSVSVGSVLWDLVAPNGLSYFNSAYAPKIGINRSDIISQFPHAGGPFAPTNALGYSDLIWSKVTTYYGLPGPGNTGNSNFIRRSIPEFGIRIVVWTDSCCVATHVTTKPPSPPVISVPTTPVNPGYNVPPIVPPTVPNPSETAAGEFATELRNSNSIVEPIPQGNRYGVNDLGPGDGRDGSLPEYAQPTKISKYEAYMPRTQGSSQGVFNYGSDYQKTLYDAEGFPLGFKSRTGTQDSYVVRRATHVGSAYMFKKNKLVDGIFIGRKSTRYSVAYPAESLDSLGLSSTAALSSDSLRVSLNRPPINTTNGSSFALPEYKGSQESFGTSQTDQSDIAARSGTNHYNSRVNESTRGGYTSYAKPTTSDFTPGSSGYTKLLGSQSRSSRVLVSRNPTASKFVKDTEKGANASDLGGITSRTISINRAVESSVRTKGFDIAAEPRYKGPKLDEMVQVKPVATISPVVDSTNRFKISFVPLRLMNGGTPTPAVMSVLEANVDTSMTLLVGNTFTINTLQGSTTYSMGSQAVEFGRVNPVQPGMYVVANPLCTPGQGFMPDIIAGGQTWNFAQLVTTLMTIEGNIIAQNTFNFSPAPANATDIIAPNKLPVGLMQSLDLFSTAEFNYEGTVSYGGANHSLWYKSEPSVIVTSVSSEQTVAIVLKATVTALTQTPPFRPVLEIYNDSVISRDPLAPTSAESAFIGSTVSSSPGWLNSPVALNTTGPGNSGLGGKGGTSAFSVDANGNIVSGPFNPGLYAGTHQCYLVFKHNSIATLNDRDPISQGTNYRIRVYNNGPYSDKYGYVLYTTGLRIPSASGAITISSGKASGSIATYHCNQLIKVRNRRTSKEIERMSNWNDGTIELAAGPTTSGLTWEPEVRLEAMTGDVLEIFRPGYDNLYSSENLIGEITVS